MSKVFRYAFIVSFAGFLFGFDMVVISGADQALQKEWATSDTFHGFVVMAMALWGTVLGAVFGAYPCKRYGRKYTLMVIGFLFFFSAVGSALAVDAFTFSVFRFIGGLGVGASTIAAPAYISEISPPKERGKLVAMYQLSIVIGVLAAMLSNYFISDWGDSAWRWMLGVEAIPALIFSLLIFKVPNSPRWLILNNKTKEAQNIIEKLALHLTIDELKRSRNATHSDSIFKKHHRRALYLIFFLAFFNQFSGINAILYYAPRIFEEAGLAKNDAFLGGIWIGMVNLLFTIVGMAIIDRFGRKSLMYWGSAGYIISLIAASIAFTNNWPGEVILIFILLFIASHAIGQGTVIWVFIAELFPTRLRASGQAFGSTVHWIFAAILPSFIPLLLNKVGAGFVFGIFAAFMIAQLLWVFRYMPETKGKSLEEINTAIGSSNSI